MQCPNCHDSKTEVFDSRKRKGGTVWRRRRCLKCCEVWTTIEAPEDKTADSVFLKQLLGSVAYSALLHQAKEKYTADPGEENA